MSRGAGQTASGLSSNGSLVNNHVDSRGRKSERTSWKATKGRVVCHPLCTCSNPVYPAIAIRSTDWPITSTDSFGSQWGGITGRGEYIRLIFEYTGTPYDENKDNSTLMTRIADPEIVGIPPNLWPPALELPN